MPEVKIAIAGILVLCALFPRLLFAAHPLITEDTGTQGRGKYQLELTTEQGYKDPDQARRHERTYSAVLSYGFRDDADAIFTVPYQHISMENDGGTETNNGRSDIGFDIKWRFYEKGMLSLALKPGITLPTGDETKGLGAGKFSYSAYLVTTVAPEPWAFHVHLGHIRNRNVVDEREDIWHASVGGWRTIGKQLKLVFDTGRDTNTDKSVATAPEFLILGAIYSPREILDLDFGLKKGVSGPETDYTLLGGITMRF